MGVRSGWERPLWFARSGPARDEYSFGRGNWFDAVGEECRAVRGGVGVLDQTSFAKFVVSGEGAEALLDRLCANRLPAEVGRMALTQMCTPRGGVETDVTVALVEPGRYYVVSAAATETHDLAWIERHAPEDGSVRIENLTARYGVLTVAGPGSRELLQRVSRDDFSNAGFPFFRARHVEVGRARMLAVRVSYVGELGWELHHPIEAQRALYDLLFEAGEDLGLVDFGYRALESMRFEKCYRLWGADLSADWSPLQAGLERFVALRQGRLHRPRRARCASASRAPRTRSPASWSTPTESMLTGWSPSTPLAERPVAYVSSGGYGHTIERSIALAYLPVEHARGRHGTDDRHPREAPPRRRLRAAAPRSGRRPPPLVAGTRVSICQLTLT